MRTVTRRPKALPEPSSVASRLPAPEDPVPVRCVLDAAELSAVEDAAHLARLSLASWVRVALIDAARHPERLAEWLAAAEAIRGTGTKGRKPGRPKKPKGGG